MLWARSVSAFSIRQWRHADLMTKTGKQRLLLGLLAAAGVVLILLGTTRYGTATSPDSAVYISAARSVVCGDGFVRYDGDPLLHWPPLLPSLLALIGLIGFDPLDTIRYVNAAAFGLVVLLTGAALRGQIETPSLRVLGSLAMLFAMPVVRVSVYAWSEVCFAVLLLTCLLALGRFLRQGATRHILISGVFAGLACMTRYAGVTVILAGLAVVALKPAIPKARRLRLGVLFLLISASPLAGWLLRNYLTASSWTGPRGPSSSSILQNVGLFLDTVTVWFLPPQVPLVGRCLLLLILALVVAVLAFGSVGSRRYRDRQSDASWVPFTLFLIIYIGFIIGAASLTSFDPINSRLLSPMFAPLVVVLLHAIERIHEYSTTGANRLLSGARALGGVPLRGIRRNRPLLRMAWRRLLTARMGTIGDGYLRTGPSATRADLQQLA